MDGFERTTWLLCFFVGIINLLLVGFAILVLFFGEFNSDKFYLIPMCLTNGVISWGFCVVIDRLCKRG